MKIGDGVLVPFTEAGTIGRGRAGLSWYTGESVKWLNSVWGLRFLVELNQVELSIRYLVWTRGDRFEGHQSIGVVEVMRLKEVVQIIHAAWEVSRATS